MQLKNLIVDGEVIGFGGSGESDLDLVYISEKLDFERIRDLKKKIEDNYKKPVSITPLTMLMLKRRCWNGKVATMIYKGVEWYYRENAGFEAPVVSLEELGEIMMRDTPFMLCHWLKMLVEKPEKKDKVLELMTQQLAVLASAEI